MDNANKEPQTWGDIMFAGCMIIVAVALFWAAVYVGGEQLAASGMTQ
jgi:hypothetical protein